MNKSSVIEEIVSYAKGDASPFALLLEGAWGSGKTKLVQDELSSALEALDEPCHVLHVSLLGAKTASEIYDRIVKAGINRLAGIDNTLHKSKKSALGTTAKEAGLTFLQTKMKKFMSEAGVDYSPSSEVLSSLLIPDHSLIVFDDVERIGNLEESELFGVIDNLVEGEARKVLIVRGAEGKSFSETIMEKLVWKTIELDPDFDQIVQEEFSKVIEPQRPIDAESTILDAIKAAGVKNIRTLKRAIPAIELLLNARYSYDDTIDPLSRSQCIRDAIKFTLMRIDGWKPRKPAETSERTTFEEALKADGERELWARWSAIPSIASLTDSASNINLDAIDSELRDYGARYYPSSAIEKKAVEKARQVSYAIADDEWAEQAKESIIEAFKQQNVCPANIPLLLRSLSLLRSWGFADDDIWRCIVEAAEGIVTNNSAEAVRAIEADPSNWLIEDSRDPREIEHLRHLAENKYLDEITATAMEIMNSGSPDALSELVEKLTMLLGLNPLSITDIPVASIANAITQGSPKGIDVFRGFIIELKSFPLIPTEILERFSDWLSGVAATLPDRIPESKMRSVQIGFLRQNLDETAKALRKRAFNPSS